MTPLEAFLLGLVQGLTEFLPVSSSGHLVLAERLFDVRFEDISFEVAVHFATLMSVVVYFFRSLVHVFFSPFRIIAGDRSEKTRGGFRLFIAVCIGSVPAIIVGLLLKSQIEALFSSTVTVSILLLVTSAILFSTRLAVSKSTLIRARNGFLIGCAQALAILPGISRSGSTIAAALFQGVDREESFNFSFVLSLPAIIGATGLTLMDALEAGPPEELICYLAGMAAAFVSGYASLVVLKRLIVTGRFHMFGFYTLIVGAIGIIFLT